MRADVRQHGGQLGIVELVFEGRHRTRIIRPLDADRTGDAVQHDRRRCRFSAVHPLRAGQRRKDTGQPRAAGLVASDTCRRKDGCTIHLFARGGSGAGQLGAGAAIDN